MQEFKFRAWDKEFKMMSEPMELFKNGQSFFFFPGIGTSGPNHESLIVMQYTGLKDKNGVEGYAEDITKDGIIRFGKYRTENLHASYDEHYGWYIDPGEPDPNTCYELVDLSSDEIIGNIYERKP